MFLAPNHLQHASHVQPESTHSLRQHQDATIAELVNIRKLRPQPHAHHAKRVPSRFRLVLLRQQYAGAAMGRVQIARQESTGQDTLRCVLTVNRDPIQRQQVQLRRQLV